MAKSKSFFGLRRGSTKTLTFQVNGGQQITKDRVTEVRNPRTKGQMKQRTIFMDAVKFYNRGVKAFFKFAFEDKKQTESDYNAFMRKNAKMGIYLRKEDYQNPLFPAIGKFYMTGGSLITPQYSVAQGTTVNDVAVSAVVTGLAASVTTVGGLSAALKSAFGLMEGDIVTLLVITSGATLNSAGTYSQNGLMVLDPDVPVQWNLQQFIVEEASTVALSTLGISCGAGSFSFSVAGDSTCAAGGCVVFSRKTSSGLKVSTSQLALNYEAESIYAEGEYNSQNTAWLETVYASWSVAEDAILEGALADRSNP